MLTKFRIISKKYEILIVQTDDQSELPELRENKNKSYSINPTNI